MNVIGTVTKNARDSNNHWHAAQFRAICNLAQSTNELNYL